MVQKITVPTLGESVTEATVSKWLKSQGETVATDEPIVELETDKVNVEVPSPSDGVLGDIAVKEGETVNVGALLGTITDITTGSQKNIEEVKKYNPPKKEEGIKITKSTILKTEIKKEEPILQLEEEPLILDKIHNEKEVKEKRYDTNKERRVSPAARKIASEKKC